MRNAFIAVLFLLIFQINGIGQSFQEYKLKYPDKQALVISKKEVVRISLDKNDSLDISLSYTSEMLHLADRTEGYAESSIPFSDFIELTEVEAKTLVPVKSSYKSIKVTEFTTKNQSSSGVFFDDNKVKAFNYPGVQPGAKTILNYKQKFKEPKLLIPYYFNFYVPVLESEITILVDKRIKLGYRLFNTTDSKVKFTESTEGNFIVYKWSGKDLHEYVLESNAPKISYHEPHLIYFIEEVAVNNQKMVFLRDTKDLYRWYYNLGIKNQKPIGKELQAIVDSLTAGVASQKEKTRKIFYWVQDHITYVAFEDGYGGFIPRDANLVCDRRFGDCKDMANILVKMLNAAGVPAYHVWIGTRDLPYSYQSLPAPNVDNHMIAAVKLDDTYTFLDATGKYCTLDLPTSMIQGKEALIGIGEDKFEVIKVPVLDPSKSKVVDTTYCSLINNVLKGKGKISMTGYNKFDYTYSLNYGKKENEKELVKELCIKGSNKFSLLNYSIKNVEKREAPILVSYEFELTDYIKSNGDEVYINLNLDRPFDKDKIDTLKRKLSIEREYKYIQEDVIFFEIPKGLKVDYLPPEVKEKNDVFEVHIYYTQEKSKIIYHKKIVVHSLLVGKSNFNDWNSINHKLSQAYREVVVLKQQ